MNDLHNSVDKNKLYFEYVGPNEDVMNIWILKNFLINLKTIVLVLVMHIKARRFF